MIWPYSSPGLKEGLACNHHRLRIAIRNFPLSTMNLSLRYPLCLFTFGVNGHVGGKHKGARYNKVRQSLHSISIAAVSFDEDELKFLD